MRTQSGRRQAEIHCPSRTLRTYTALGQCRPRRMPRRSLANTANARCSAPQAISQITSTEWWCSPTWLPPNYQARLPPSTTTAPKCPNSIWTYSTRWASTSSWICPRSLLATTRTRSSTTSLSHKRTIWGSWGSEAVAAAVRKHHKVTTIWILITISRRRMQVKVRINISSFKSQISSMWHSGARSSPYTTSFRCSAPWQKKRRWTHAYCVNYKRRIRRGQSSKK